MAAKSRDERQAWRFWFDALADPGAGIGTPWAGPWQPYRNDVKFILRSIGAAFKLRHDPHVGEYARATLKAQLAALATFDPAAPDGGAGAFALALDKFRGDWNALVAARAKDQPRRAAEENRLTGEATRADARRAWIADVQAGCPAHGRIQRVAVAIRRPYSTARDALLKLGLIPARKTAKNG